MRSLPPLAVCHTLARAIGRTETVDEICTIALDTAEGLGVERAAILLLEDGAMRAKAARRLSDAWARAIEGHTFWSPDAADPDAIVVAAADGPAGSILPAVVAAEGLAAMACLPLVGQGRVIGALVLGYEAPPDLTPDALQLASLVAAQVAFAVARTRAEDQARRSEARLRFALDAACMGTWDWDLRTNTIEWSDNLEALHGLAPGSFDGRFSSYAREIHPEDRERVLAAARRALSSGLPYDVEYRIVAPDGTIRWVEGKGQVVERDGQPMGLTGVCMVVTRRKEAEISRLAAAEEASRLKDEFLATLSHELRTPLNAVLGWVQILEAGGLSPDRVHGALETIGRNAKLQAQLIEDMLDVSRIIGGKLEIERQPVYLPQIVDAVVIGALPAAAARRLEIARHVPADLPPIEGDPRRLQQVFGNVLSNAMKFTPEGGRIQIHAVEHAGAIEIEVRDSGIGIAPEFLPYVFDRFRQADSRVIRRHGGLGLGLAIARHLVEQHRGEIEARSDGPDQGTAIVVRLPVASAGSRDAAPAAAWGAAPRVKLEGCTVLVVDDERDSCEVVGVLLQRCGAKVVQCDGAASALRAIEAAPVHLIVADIAMPEVDGYELIRAVRRRGTRVPAVAVSACARPVDRHKAIAAGFLAYCAKPIEASRFLEAVRDVMQLAPAMEP